MLHTELAHLLLEVLEGNHIKFSSHFVFQTLAVSCSYNRFIPSHMLHTELAHLLLEVVLVADGKVVSTELLANLQNPVPPVIGSLRVLLIVDSKVSNNQRHLEILCIVSSSMPTQAMIIAGNPRGQSTFVCGRSIVNECSVLELVVQVFGSV